MKIIFVLTLLILTTLFIIIQKSKQKLNLTEWTIIGIVMILGYNTIIYYAFYLLKMAINLKNFSLVNMVFIVIFIQKIIRDKQCQKFYFDKQEIIQKLVITIGIIIICLWNYGIQLDIKYASIDGATHCKAVIQFAESEELSKDFKGFMPMAYVNTGLIVKVIENIDVYKIFIIFDIFVLILIALTMNSILIKYCNKKSNRIIAMFITILYILGYPLNSIFYGFSYLSISIVVINTIFIFMQNYNNNKLNYKINVISMFILNFSLFFSYYFFVPVIYGAEITYILNLYIRKLELLRNNRNNKKEILRFRKKVIAKQLIMLIICIIIPTICGLKYHIFYGENKLDEIKTGIVVEGCIYENILVDFVIILPIILYIFFKEKKKHKYYIYYVLIFMILYMGFIGYLVFLGKISFYYFIKNMFILWGICSIIICNYILKLKKQIKLPILIIVTSIFIAFSNIYYENLSIIQNIHEYKVIYTKNELEILEKSKELVNFSDSVSIIGTHLKRGWAIVFTEYSNVSNEIKFEEANYIIYFYNANISKEYMDNLISNMDLLYENESGAIYRKKL